MKNFTQIQNEIVKNISIPDGAFRTYLILRSFQYGLGKVFPSQETLSKLRGKSKKTIISHLKKLKSLGLIEYKRRGYSASNQYYFIKEEIYTNDKNNRANYFSSKMNKTSPLSLHKFQPNNTDIKNIETIISIDIKKMEDWKKVMKERAPNLKWKK